GQVDDWFSLLNTGRRYTALGNSDTHGKFAIEAGCPRNYVITDTDEPALLDEQAIADAVRAGRVVASYGPFVRFTADGSYTLGDTVPATDGTVDLHIEVQAPTWIPVDRVELYQNGTLVQEWTDLDEDIFRLTEDVTVTVDKDSWFVVVALGDGDLGPVFTPVEMPPVQLQDVVTEALSDVPAVGSLLSPAIPIPRTGPVVPYALTNPIYVDVDGGDWTPPGLPAWLLPPVEPEEPGE
ncbi:MAG: CehA/McbA family metallohydrolase, partial [Myxococcota bacterium]